MTPVCQWCEKPAIGMIVVEPAKHRIVKGQHVVVHPDRLAHVCGDHVNPQHVDLQAQRRAQGHQARRWQMNQYTIEDLL